MSAAARSNRSTEKRLPPLVTPMYLDVPPGFCGHTKPPRATPVASHERQHFVAVRFLGVACLSAAMSGTAEPRKQIIPSARRILEKSVPLQTAINRSSGYTTIGGEQRLVWKPDLERIERVVVKNARGHAFFEMGEPMMHKPSSVKIVPLEYMTAQDRAEFEDIDENGVLPEVGSRMMTRVFTGEDLTDHGWVLVQEGVYRYVAMQSGLMTVRSMLYEFLRHRSILGSPLTPNAYLPEKSGQQPSSSCDPVRS
jgi:hypothetical protein